MTGKGHLVSGSILIADTYLCGCFLPHLPVSAVFIKTVDDFVNMHFDVFAHQDNFIFRMFTVALSIVFYYLGLLLPDIDTKSMISHIFKFSLPIIHRGLTHTIYVLVLIIIGSITFYPLRFLGLGFLIHVLIDSLSPAGWVPFYPIGRYYVRNETVITKGKHLVLYTSDGYSEDILLIIMFGVSMLTFICLYVCFIA